jgi:membrane fusion protein (multidrug efflux system)
VDVRVPVHERELPRIAIGNRVTAKFPSMGQSAEGTVTFISPEINPKTRSAEVVTRIPNPDGAIRAGMFTEISIAPHGNHESLVVPRAAVGGPGERRYVFVVSGETVEQRPVKVSPIDSDRMEVLEGVQLNEEIVATGIGRLSNGVRVTRGAEPNVEAAAKPSEAEQPSAPAEKQQPSAEKAEQNGAKP